MTEAAIVIEVVLEAVLAGVSGASLAGAMGFAAVYAAGTYLGRSWLDIPAMVRIHATANVFGFALPGLLFWVAVRPRGAPLHVRARSASGPAVLWRWLGEEPSLQGWEARGFSAAAEAGPARADARDHHGLDIGLEAPGAPEPGGPHRRAAAAVLDFDVFPPDRLAPVVRRCPIEAGDTLGCLCRLPLGFGAFFAAPGGRGLR